MAHRDLYAQHWQNLQEAMRTESIDRRTFMKVAGSAALAMGLTKGAASAAPNPSIGKVVMRGQAASNILVYGSGQDISNLDPHTGHDYSISWGQKAVYDSLLYYVGNPNTTIEPLLATEVTSNTDATEWTVKLNPAAKFHDGSAVTAEAVQYNFQRCLRKNLGVAYMFASIMTQDSVTVVDPTTLKITLTKPFGAFTAILPWLFIANPAVVQANEKDGDEGEAWLASNEAGSGPYTISRWELGAAFEFTKWADYWFAPEGVNMVDKMIWRVIRESSTRRIAMETGETQFGDFLTPEDYEALGAGGFTVNTIPSITPFAFKLNNATGPTSDINVRRALLQAYDYQAAIDAMSGYGEIMQGPLATSLKPWHKDDLQTLKFDMEGAKASLAASAEYSGGFELEYVYVSGFTPEEQFGLILLETAAELNIDVKMVPLLWPDMVARAADPATSPAAMAVYSGTDYVDPDNFLFQSYHSSQAGSWSAASHYKNAELDALLEQGRATSDQAARKEIYDKAQQKLVDDSVEIWIYTEIPLAAWDKGLNADVIPPIMGGDLRTFGYTSTT